MSNVAAGLFAEDLMFFDYEADSFQALFESIGACLVARGYVKETWAAAVLERELQYPTGLPTEGIVTALPHTSSPEHTIKPGIALVKLRKPVTFMEMGSDDGQVDVQLVFFIIGNQTNDQVTLLQKLIQLLGDKELLLSFWDGLSDERSMLRQAQTFFS